MSDDTRDQPMPDDLKVDVDQEKLANWDDVSDQYAGEGEDKKRPVFTDNEAASGNAGDSAEGDADHASDESQDAAAETLDDADD